jgi:chromosome segregation ATPase
MLLQEHWKELGTLVVAIIAYLGGRKSKKIQDKKESAIAEQEQIKIKKEEVGLTIMIQDVYRKGVEDFAKRLQNLEESNKDLTNKYGEILLRNAILEERAETYEQKYKGLEKDYIKLKSDHDKIHKENKEIRKELDQLKNKTE